MDVNVDPKEVVEHLHELGFSNITSEQLSAFIKDLKKLIKYDIRACKCQHVVTKEYSYVENSSGTFHSLKSSCTRSENNNNSTIFRQNSYCETSNESTPNEFDETGSSSSSSGVSISSVDTSVTAGSLQHAVNSGITGKPIDGAHKKKLKSAFIRSWNLQKGVVPSGTVHRSDPVKMYHQYQSIWKKQKIPGENCHADLRWAIRERMLGEDPHPRPVSHASSISMLQRRKKM